MAMNNSFNYPMGGYVPLVDKMIGTAYDVVRRVHDRLPEISQLSLYMEKIINVDTSIVDVGVVADNILTVAQVASIRQQVIQLAPITQQLVDIAVHRAELVALTPELPELLAVHAQLSKLVSLFNSMIQINAVGNNIDAVITVSQQVSKITVIHQNISVLVALANNTAAMVNLNSNSAALLELNSEVPMLVEVHGALDTVSAVNTALPSITAVNAKLIQLQAIYDNLDAILAGEIYTPAEKTKLAAVPLQTVLTGVTGPAVSGTTSISLGSIAKTGIRSVTVRVTAANGDIYFPGSTTFQFVIVGTNLQVVTSPDATAALLSANISATVNHVPVA